MARAALSAAGLAMVVGCAKAGPEMAGLPPIPPHHGELAIDVVYPRDSALIAARDSNFIFGSVGNGDARLTINGRTVRVQPNGSFLAWLPVPFAPTDSLTYYELVASLNGQEVRAVRTVRLRPTDRPLAPDAAVIDPASAAPRGAWWVREGEVIPLGVRATPGARVRLLLPAGGAVSLEEVGTQAVGSAANWIFGSVPWVGSGSAFSTGLYRGALVAGQALGRGRLNPALPPVSVDASGIAPHCAPPPQGSSEAVADPANTNRLAVSVSNAAANRRETAAQDSAAGAWPECAILEVALPGDTVRAPLPLDLWIVEGTGSTAELREEPSGVGRDGFVVGRAAPGATTLWMWSDGVRALATGRRNGSVRLRLDGRTEAWAALDELVPLDDVSLPWRARVGTVRLEGRPDRVEVRVEVSEPVPYHVEVEDDRLSLLLYGAYSNTDWLRYGAEDDFVQSVRWEQVDAERYILRFQLAGRPWGYRARYGGGGLTLEIRKPPPVEARRPLAGLKVAVDPGHPPVGATGPTRLYEGDANLAVSFRLKRLLEAEGARVIMTRTDRSVVRLYDRTQLAELLDAHVLVSIHNNALPDGVNPFENHGTSVYYFHDQALDLARALQNGLLASMGLADLGVGRASLALARPTWMPAALTEGAFMMIPDQEAALRGPAFQEAYARGVLEGLRAFVRRRLE